MRHPSELGAPQVEAFLSDLAVRGNVAASTQNRAKSAILFLYREVLGTELPWLDGVQSAKRPQRLPVVLTQDQVAALLSRMSGPTGLIARLLYGTGMRLIEGVRLRVKDVDFERIEIMVRDGKGAKDRVTMLPEALELLGHKDVQTTMIYTHVLNRGGSGVRSPLDRAGGPGTVRSPLGAEQEQSHYRVAPLPVRTEHDWRPPSV